MASGFRYASSYSLGIEKLPKFRSRPFRFGCVHGDYKFANGREIRCGPAAFDSIERLRRTPARRANSACDRPAACRRRSSLAASEVLSISRDVARASPDVSWTWSTPALAEPVKLRLPQNHVTDSIQFHSLAVNRRRLLLAIAVLHMTLGIIRGIALHVKCIRFQINLFRPPASASSPAVPSRRLRHDAGATSHNARGRGTGERRDAGREWRHLRIAAKRLTLTGGADRVSVRLPGRGQVADAHRRAPA